MNDPLEIPVGHRCHLGDLVDELAECARGGERGDRLAERARSKLAELLRSRKFDRCCVPEYLAVAPKTFERERHIPVASAGPASLDARVLLWRSGTKDAQHPHNEAGEALRAVPGSAAAHVRHNADA